MKTVLGLSAALALGACTSIQGPTRILDQHARVTKEVPDGSIFREDFTSALNARRSSASVHPALVRAMLSSGFTHIYSFCDNYFDVMGMRQTESRVTRDAIAPISALITGLMAIRNFDSNPRHKENMLAVLGLATASTAAALNIYDEHMLFGSENIGAVETLTKNALSAHSAEILGFQDEVSFDAALRHLLDNQAKCSPQQILILAREAIREGNVEAEAGTTTPAGGAAAPDPNKSVKVLIQNR